jgi:hypothetical protein
MKTLTIHFVRVMMLLTLYVCCSSVVCCEASTATVPVSEKESNSAGTSKQSFDDELTPLHLISVRLMDLL